MNRSDTPIDYYIRAVEMNSSELWLFFCREYDRNQHRPKGWYRVLFHDHTIEEPQLHSLIVPIQHLSRRSSEYQYYFEHHHQSASQISIVPGLVRSVQCLTVCVFLLVIIARFYTWKEWTDGNNTRQICLSGKYG